MTDSPALCPECGSLLRAFEAQARLYLGCDEPGCLWMNRPINLSLGEVDLEVVLRDAQSDPGE